MLKNYFYFDPKEYDFTGAQVWLQEFFNPDKSINEKTKNLLNLKINHDEKLIKDTLYISCTPAPDTDTFLDIKNIIFNSLTQDSDNVHNNEVNKFIAQGLALMQTSIDPAHDINHIFRTIKFAKLIIDFEKLSIDWGMLCAALVWHDIYRAENLGVIYKNQHGPILGRLFGQLKKIHLIQNINAFTV